jgi:hypothetical protein
LGNFGGFWLSWLRWDFEITALCEQASHMHLVDDVDIKVVVCLSNPLRSSSAEHLSFTIGAGAGFLDEGDGISLLEWCLPIIDRLIWVE